MKSLKFLLLFLSIFIGNLSTAQNACDNALKFINNFQFSQAISALDECYSTDSLNVTYLNQKGYCYLKTGQLQDAKKSFLKILGVNSNNLQALNQLGSILEKENNFKDGLYVYQHLIEIDSTNGYYYQRKAQIFEKNNQPYSAIADYNKALKLNPKDLESIVSLTRLYFSLELFQDALEVANKGLELQANNSKLLAYKMKVLYQLEDFNTVLTVSDRYFELGNDTTLLLAKVIGISQYHEKEFVESISTLEKVYNAQEPEIVAYFIGIAYREIGNHSQSISYLNKAIDKGVSNNISTYYTNLAITYEEQEMYPQAIKAYQTAYKSSKENILLYHLARNYDLYYKDKKTAIEYYNLYLETKDSENVVYLNYSEHRISELKQAIHFGLDTLN